jgi:hypothetical protein
MFGFTADLAGNNEVTTVPDTEVYSCVGTPEGLSGGEFSFAVFKVDRPVTGRVPLFVRYTGSAIGEQVILTGYPIGLPLRVSTDGRVERDRGDTNFVTSVDVFSRQAGSPVINAATGVVEGIHLLRPYFDFVLQGTCAVVNVCAQNGCDPHFANSTEFATATRFPPITNQVRIPPHPALLTL